MAGMALATVRAAPAALTSLGWALLAALRLPFSTARKSFSCASRVK